MASAYRPHYGTNLAVAHLRLFPILLALLMGMAGSAMAQPSFSPEATDALPEGNGRTYLDLIRLVMPGIAVSGSAYSDAHQPTGIRHLGGWIDGDIGLAPTGTLGLQAVPLRSGGRQRLVLLVDFGMTEYSVGYAILALFDIEGDARLLDAADVALDRWTSFMDPVRLPVGADDDLLVIQSTHHNSSQSFLSASLILVRNDQFELVDTISLLGDRAYGFERTQELTIEQRAGEPFADIAVSVTETTELTAVDQDDGTLPEPGSRAITVTYRWDTAAQRYMPDSNALTTLARENEERF